MKSPTHITIGALTYANYLMLTGKNFNILDIPICLAFSVLPDIDTQHSKISSNLRNIPMKLILYTLFIIFALIICYFSLVKQILPKYFVLFIPVMILFLKLFSKNKILKKISLSLFFIALYIASYKYTLIGNTKNILLLFAIVPFFTHRGFSHSILSIFLISTILYPIYKIPQTRSYYIVMILAYLSHILMGDIFTKKGVPLLYPFSKKYYSLNIFTNSKIYNNLDIPFIVLYGIITSLIFLKIFIN